MFTFRELDLTFHFLFPARRRALRPCRRARSARVAGRRQTVRSAKEPPLHCKTDQTTAQSRPYHPPKWTIPECETSSFTRPERQVWSDIYRKQMCINDLYKLLIFAKFGAEGASGRHDANSERPARRKFNNRTPLFLFFYMSAGA